MLLLCNKTPFPCPSLLLSSLFGALEQVADLTHWAPWVGPVTLVTTVLSPMASLGIELFWSLGFFWFYISFWHQKLQDWRPSWRCAL
jgi:hypothetical protein